MNCPPIFSLVYPTAPMHESSSRANYCYLTHVVEFLIAPSGHGRKEKLNSLSSRAHGRGSLSSRDARKSYILVLHNFLVGKEKEKTIIFIQRGGDGASSETIAARFKSRKLPVHAAV